MALYTTDFFIRPEDGWTLVATNPSELIIRPAVYHPWRVAIVDTGTPAATVVGVPMGRDPSQRNQEYHLFDGVTGLVYVRIATPTDSNVGEKMMFSVTTSPGSTGGAGTAEFVTSGPAFVPNGSITSGSGTVTAGGVAQDILAAGTTPHGWSVQNQSSTDLYVRQTTAATADQNSIRIPAGMMYTADFVNLDKVSIFGATTGQPFWARGW